MTAAEKTTESNSESAPAKTVAFVVPYVPQAAAGLTVPRTSGHSNTSSSTDSKAASPAAYLTEGIAAYSVHPDFNGGGNVLVLAHDGEGGRVGFRVSGFHLSAVSPTFKAALVGHLHAPCTLHLSDAADDVASFLRMFKLAPSATWGRYDPPMATYYRVLVLLEKYHCHEFLRAAFAAKLAASSRYGDGLGWEPFYVLVMAHRLRAEGVWAAVLPRLAKWRVDPATMTPEQVNVLGPELYRILVAVNALSGGGKAFQCVKGISVVYKDGLAVVCPP